MNRKELEKLKQEATSLGIDDLYQEGIYNLVESKLLELRAHGITGPVPRAVVEHRYGWRFRFADVAELLRPVPDRRDRGNRTVYGLEEYVAFLVARDWASDKNRPPFLKGKTGVHELYLEYIRDVALSQLDQNHP